MEADLLRWIVIAGTCVLAILIALQLVKWHMEPNGFDLRDLLMTMGRDKKQHISRAAMFELGAFFATTSGYLGTLAVRPQDYETSTLVYGGLWVIRGGYSTYLRSKQK
jgi:hypothetical protein